MADASYRHLLDATIQHLEDLKSRGAKFVDVQPATLAALGAPVTRTKATVHRSKPVGAPEQPPQPPGFGVRQPSAGLAVPITTPTPTMPATEPRSPAAKQAAMAALRTKALACTKCAHLVKSRTQVVFGVGDINAQLMFVGEAPGADEDAQGEPFVGKAGQLLTRIIQTMGLSREQVYIGNILKCRPDTPGQTAGNRKPTPEEMKTCFPYLQEQIALIQPKALVALGGTAVLGLLGQEVQITKFRGRWQTYQGIPVMPTYHPSYLLRNQSLPIKREVWEDMLAVMERLGMAISDKQRGFFLK